MPRSSLHLKAFFSLLIFFHPNRSFATHFLKFCTISAKYADSVSHQSLTMYVEICGRLVFDSVCSKQRSAFLSKIHRPGGALAENMNRIFLVFQHPLIDPEQCQSPHLP